MTYYCVTTSINDHGKVHAMITSSIEADKMPDGTFISTRFKDVYTDWFDSFEEAKDFVRQSKNA